MKRTHKLIAILLAVELIASSAVMCVFATDEVVPGDNNDPAGTDLLVEGANGGAGVTGGDVNNNDDPENVNVQTPAPGEPSDPADPENPADPEVEGTDPVVEGELLRSAVVEAPTATADGAKVTLTWTSEGITKAYCYTSEDAADPEKTIDVAEGQTSVDFDGLSYETDYWFAIGTADGVSAKVKCTTGELVLAAPANFAATPSHQSVTLYWKSTEGAEKYVIYRNNTLLKTVDATSAAVVSYRDTSAAKDTTYSYKVKALAGGKSSDFSNSSSAARVRTAYYNCTFKAGVKLKSHDSAKKAVKFKKGQTVRAEGYGKGAYKFTYNGRPYEAKWFRMKKASANYSRYAYDNISYDLNGNGSIDNNNERYVVAYNYVNQGGYSSSSRYLVWISIYSQRVYVLSGYTGHWNVVYSWACNTGKAKSPTPGGDRSIQKKILKHYKKHSKHKYWSTFQSANAIHGRNKKDAAPGKVVSNGCVRVSNDQAYWLMKNVAIGSRVLSF